MRSAGAVRVAVLAVLMTATGLIASVPTSADQGRGGANPVLVLETARGTITIELLRQDAPKTVDYVTGLVKKNFYRGLRFHRAERALIQVGDPTSRDVSRKAWWGRTGTTPTVGVAEISKRLTHVRGAVGLAHTGDPKFASSHIYIMRTASPGLDGKFTIFGRVTSGLPIVDAIREADVLKLASIK
jgi:cyclophilin family peptidyl-prolyl cis-trans isomerase